MKIGKILITSTLHAGENGAISGTKLPPARFTGTRWKL